MRRAQAHSLSNLLPWLPQYGDDCSDSGLHLHELKKKGGWLLEVLSEDPE